MKQLKHQTTGKLPSKQSKDWTEDEELADTQYKKEKGKQNAKKSNNKKEN